MAPSDWADPERRFIKRNLSTYEKRSLLVTSGRALVFPGSPETEIEELTEVGFDPEKIHGIERDQGTADALYVHYMDTAHIHWIEAEEFIDKAQGKFSYVHLDFCNYFDSTALRCVEGLAGKLAPIARVRVSLYRSRKGDAQRSFERILHEKVLEALLLMAAEDDHFAADAQETIRICQDSGEVTQAVIAVMLLNYTFGLRALPFADLITADTKYPLPSAAGTHRMNTVRRIEYHEPHGNHMMSTLWADLVPLRGTAMIQSASWRRREIAHVLETLRTPPTEYGNPAAFS